MPRSRSRRSRGRQHASTPGVPMSAEPARRRRTGRSSTTHRRWPQTARAARSVPRRARPEDSSCGGFRAHRSVSGDVAQRPLRLGPWFRGGDALPQLFEIEANRCMRSYQVAENFVSLPDRAIRRAGGPRGRATNACARGAAAWPRGTRAPCPADSHPRSGALDTRSAAARRAARATGA